MCRWYVLYSPWLPTQPQINVPIIKSFICVLICGDVRVQETFVSSVFTSANWMSDAFFLWKPDRLVKISNRLVNSRFYMAVRCYLSIAQT